MCTMNFNWTDNVVTRALSKIFDMVCLNLLWILCSIPIFTIGASTTALYTVMLKMVKNEEGYIFRGFFKAFKDNFKQATIMWLVILALAVVWWVDFNFSGAIGGNIGFALNVIFILLGILLLSVAIYVFPLTARYVNTVRNTFKNALILTIARLPYTLLMIVIMIAAVVFSFWTVQTLMLALPLWMLIGVSLITWVYSWLLRRVFTVFEDADKNDTKEGMEG